MGTLGDNLLKLIEFPFSYSFIGLLALIFGEGLNLEEATISTLGPLLILMGFVATTLSITDPIGALQKVLLKGRTGGSIESLEHRPDKEAPEFFMFNVFGTNMRRVFVTGKDFGDYGRENPEPLYTPLASLGDTFLIRYQNDVQDESEKERASSTAEPFKVMEKEEQWEVAMKALSLRDGVLTTKWIAREN